MILNHTRATEELRILSAIIASPYQFYLSGSRFFTPSSLSSQSHTHDWDFFVQADPNEYVLNWLKELGFIVRNEQQLHVGELSNNCAAKLRHPAGVGIDVRVVFDARMEEDIHQMFLARNLCRHDAALWAVAFLAYQTAQEHESR